MDVLFSASSEHLAYHKLRIIWGRITEASAVGVLFLFPKKRGLNFTYCEALVAPMTKRNQLLRVIEAVGNTVHL